VHENVPIIGSIVIVLRHTALRSSCHKWLAELFPQAEISEAATGNEGIHHALKSPGSIVLLDQDLPDMTGVSAMKLIQRANKSNAFVILSVMNSPIAVRIPAEPRSEAWLNEQDLFERLPLIIERWMVNGKFSCLSYGNTQNYFSEKPQPFT